MISKSEFLNRVHGSIFPLLKKSETERRAIFQKWAIGMVILSIVLTVLACYILSYYGIVLERAMQKGSYWGVIPIFTAMFPIVIGDLKLKEFSCKLKEKLIPVLYDLVELKKKEKTTPVKKVSFEEEIEECSKEIGFDEFLDKGLFPTDSYLDGFDDVFFTKDNSFSVREINVKTGHGRNATQVFMGGVFETNSDVKIGGKILILQKLKMLSSKRFKPKKSLNYQKMEINDAMFDNHFQVYAENEMDVKSVLNKMFLRKILSLRDIYPKAIINLLIENGKITITFNTDKDMFEFFSIYRSLLNDKLFEKFYDEVANLYKVRDIFKS